MTHRRIYSGPIGGRTRASRGLAALAVVLAATGACMPGAGSRDAGTTGAADEQEEAQPARPIVEFRSYNLEPGSRPEFHRLVQETMPMLERWDVDVIGYGPSPHDETSYFLIRRFESLEQRRRSEDAFYGSAEWREGPRDAILARIQSYTTVVLELDGATVAGLRASLAR
jgi:hypothetical protein